MGMTTKPLRESTVRAAARDIQKALLRSDSVSVLGAGDYREIVTQALENAVEDGKISKANQLAVSAAVQKAVEKAFLTDSAGNVKADVLRQVQAVGMGLTTEATRAVAKEVVQALCDRVPPSEVDSFITAFLERPTNAMRMVLIHKKKNFITRGVSDQETEASIKKELSKELRGAVEKSRA